MTNSSAEPTNSRLKVLAGYCQSWLLKPFLTIFSAGSTWRARSSAFLQCVAVLGAALITGLILLTLALIPFTPSISDLKKTKTERPSVLISVDGKQLATYKQFNREWVALSKMAPHTIEALIATEDHRFYQHHGVDFYRLGGAVLSTLGGKLQGGSTITQQLARNLYPDEIGRSRSIVRKIKETITALKIERAMTKKEILETYLNTVPFLYNAFGIEMAARTYFDKSAGKLSLGESATLIGMLKGTSYYNPVLNSQRATARRNVVLAQMLKRGKLSKSAYDSAKKRAINLDFERQLEARGIAPHFAEHVRKWLVNWADRNNYNIYTDGLKIYTTIDSRLQVAALQSVKRRANALQAVADVEWARASQQLLSTSTAAYVAAQAQITPFSYFWATNPDLMKKFIQESSSYRNAVAGGADGSDTLAKLEQDGQYMARLRAAKSRLEAGMVAIDPTSGDIKAWVGSRDFNLDQYDHVARAQRQPGSTFKPFVYGAAIENGMSPQQKYIDQIITYRTADGEMWRPQDNSAPTNDQMTAAQALSLSKNTVTAQIMQETGPRKVVEFAKRSGVRYSNLADVPSLALGTSPVTLLEMAASYATIANGGQYQQPVMVTRVEDARGNVLMAFPSSAKREMSRSTAEKLVSMMHGVVDVGTAKALRTQFGIRSDIAGKTGTTQDNTDGWFLMMHPHLVTGAWVGFNDARMTMRSNYWGQGAHNALPIVADFFQQASAGKMIDVNQRFQRARDAWPGSSIWGPPLDWVEELFSGIGAIGQPSETSPKESTPQYERAEKRLTEKRSAPELKPEPQPELQQGSPQFSKSTSNPDLQPESQPVKPLPPRHVPATEFEKAIESGRGAVDETKRQWNNVNEVVEAVEKLLN